MNWSQARGFDGLEPRHWGKLVFYELEIGAKEAQLLVR